MSSYSLVALLDEDKEMVLTNLNGDRTLPAAQQALEKAVDRVMYRYVELCEDPALRDSAQHILQAIKNTLPVMDAVGEVRAWKKQAESARRKGLQMRPMTLAILLAGALLVLASVLGLMFVSRGGALTFLPLLLPVLLGCGGLFWAGAKSAQPPKQRDDAPEAVRTEYLVDVEKAWHCLRGAMLLADGQLERIREERAVQTQREAEATPAGGLSSRELELFAELLESAYAAQGDGSRETISAIRFFLHGSGIETADYEPGLESWFEFLPAPKRGTLRPALVSGGRLIKKGMASAQR